MRIVKRAWTEETTWRERSFLWNDGTTAGFGFPCNEQGEVDQGELNEAARANLRSCLDGTYDVIDEGVKVYTQSYRHPSVGKCSCGSTVELGRFTNTCDGCGADYNSAGQRLADRRFWGEETGEQACDVLRGDL